LLHMSSPRSVPSFAKCLEHAQSILAITPAMLVETAAIEHLQATDLRNEYGFIMTLQTLM